jgi:hypothetical protein
MITKLLCFVPTPFFHPPATRVVIHHALPEELSWLPLAIILMLIGQIILSTAILLIYRKLNKQSATTAWLFITLSYNTIMRHSTAKLEAFFREVTQLTLNHDCVGDHAVVFPSKLGAALVKVDPEWWTCKPVNDDDDEMGA